MLSPHLAETLCETNEECLKNQPHVGREATEGVDAVGDPRHGVALEEKLIHDCKRMCQHSGSDICCVY